MVCSVAAYGIGSLVMIRGIRSVGSRGGYVTVRGKWSSPTSHERSVRDAVRSLRISGVDVADAYAAPIRVTEVEARVEIVSMHGRKRVTPQRRPAADVVDRRLQVRIRCLCEIVAWAASLAQDGRVVVTLETRCVLRGRGCNDGRAC